MTTTTHILWLPYSRPPLTANQRLHWAAKARITADVRRTTMLLARAAKLPRDREHVTVALHYVPRDRRRRDADNLVPTLKAACDGLVDAGLVPDDTPDQMAKHMPVIDPPQREAPGPRGGRLYLTITEGEQP
ncbi:crossover junction endodeoxyribonuclease RusA superfamily protein [Corynebacterium freneyi]|uniref:Uncharacterized protein n=1 Tax=Corynebacterium freneyi DNF00450 TaxID=1287475 RepID=A0A096A959_9CORY|nr:crossover junction endodeoxyribonuclease RusA superfamily protein [Corynebacterium freneyi]KGF17384.1 hypothetical protein HMPREF1650_04280 [Corynebacterium freneyi DNF00450]